MNIATGVYAGCRRVLGWQMAYIEGWDRSQPNLLPESLEDYVSEDNPVRFLDAFVDGLELHKVGMNCKQPGSVGRDGYDPRVLLKLYIYGYLNRIRSSRGLERETKRNLEVIWLLGKLQPDHWTINDFRRRHGECFKEILREFNLLCMKVGLFGAELVALDGTFLKAVNSKARNFTAAKLEKLMARIDERIAQYVEDLDHSRAHEDGQDDGGDPGSGNSSGPDNATAKAIAELEEKRARYEELAQEAGDSETGQVSLSDPDSRHLQKGAKSMVGYNGQIAVDAKHHLIVCAGLSNDGNDLQQLSPMSMAAKEELGVSGLKVAADGGYHNLAQLAECEQAGIEVYAPQRQERMARRDLYALSMFHYDAQADEYRCPEGQPLHRHRDYRSRGATFRSYYNTAACRNCPVRECCTQGKYRKLSIHTHAAAGQRVARRMSEDPDVYARRKGLVEHVFGTLRSWWGLEGFLTKGLASTRAEWMLGCLSYNIRRALNVLGTRKLMAALTL